MKLEFEKHLIASLPISNGMYANHFSLYSHKMVHTLDIRVFIMGNVHYGIVETIQSI
jgi:hypothetical protein